MKYYAVVELVIRDEGWLADYVANVTPIVYKHGGKYLSRTNKLEKVEGDRALPNVVVLLEFPSREAALAMYNDPAYKPYLEARKAGSSGEFTLVGGEDMTGAAKV